MNQACSLQVTVRNATTDDLRDILKLYNDQVTSGTALWNETPRSLDQLHQWYQTQSSHSYPVLIATITTTTTTTTITASSDPSESPGSRDTRAHFAGYATYGSFRPQHGFKHTVEHSLYVVPEARGKGVGHTLLGKLMEMARESQVHVMVAAIAAENQASVRLHEKAGFMVSGMIPQSGQKFGRWLDLLFMHKILD